jgi:hypothetical protein
MQVIQGQTRIVLVFKTFVIKFPNFLKGYRQFLYGLISNQQEKQYSGTNKYLMPVTFAFIGYLFIVMPKAEILTTPPDKKTFEKITFLINYPHVDYKADSFGFYKNNLVIIDYGTTFK